jgi:hypothetical protein
MGVKDFLIAAPILGTALYVLYRSTFRSGGKCVGCSGGCATPPPKAGKLVTLGRPQGGRGASPGRQIHRV